MATCGCSVAQPSVTQFVVKIQGGCNLFCHSDDGYVCYGDYGAAAANLTMTRSTMRATAKRIGEQARRYPEYGVEVTLHGGEPLMGGVGPIKYFIEQLLKYVPKAQLSVSMQTNGVALRNKHLVRQLKELGRKVRFRIGVSLDGTEESHNKTRRFKDGRGSWRQVIEGIINLVTIAPELFAGLLCVIDIDADPVDTLEVLLRYAYNPIDAGRKPEDRTKIDFLLPHGTHGILPRGKVFENDVYGRWLAEAAEWYFGMLPAVPWKIMRNPQITPLLKTPDGSAYVPPRVRIFDEMLYMVQGACASRTMLLGGPVHEPLVIGWDGSYQLYDALELLGPDVVKMHWNGAVNVRQRYGWLRLKKIRLDIGEAMSVHNAPIHLAALASKRWNNEHQVQGRLADGRPDLCDTCLGCPYLRECGGGLFVWRQSDHDDPEHGVVAGYFNPHIYCRDYMFLIEYFRRLVDPLGLYVPEPTAPCGETHYDVTRS